MHVSHSPQYSLTELKLEEPCWKHHKFYPLTPSTKQWLLDQGSLTLRLLTASQGHFAVKILTQQWQRPRKSEAAMLAMKPRQLAIIREVILLCNDEPWVFARSIIPASSVNGRLRRLRKFDNSSLGAMLFKEPSMRRQAFQLAMINGFNEQLPTSLHQPQALWGRRCLFRLVNKPIIVSEIFLPAFKP